MTPQEEAAYLKGSEAAHTSHLQHALEQLGHQGRLDDVLAYLKATKFSTEHREGGGNEPQRYLDPNKVLCETTLLLERLARSRGLPTDLVPRIMPRPIELIAMLEQEFENMDAPTALPPTPPVIERIRRFMALPYEIRDRTTLSMNASEMVDVVKYWDAVQQVVSRKPGASRAAPCWGGGAGSTGSGGTAGGYGHTGGGGGAGPTINGLPIGYGGAAFDPENTGRGGAGR